MNAAAPIAWVVGTFDTKAEELNYIARLIREAGVAAVTVDVSTSGTSSGADVPAEEVAKYHPGGPWTVFGANDRGLAGMAMRDALCVLVGERLKSGAISGMIGIGGSGGTSMVAPAMRMLPIGAPKLLVSTLAAGNMAPFVDVVDMTSMFPVTDLAGLNRLSRTILANAAHAMAGMLLRSPPPAPADSKPVIGMSMFGVTTPGVQAVKRLLGNGYDVQVYHANGAGGRTLERLAASGQFEAIVDLTTTEVGQHIAGAVCDAGPNRLEAAALHGVPWIGSLGALDMLNWGAMDTVPEVHRGRLFHRHNADVTLMRTTASELEAAGRRIADQLNRSPGPVWLFVPEGGLSALDAPGQAFHDPAANQALFDTLEQHFQRTPVHHMVRLPFHINDPQFAEAVAQQVRSLVQPEDAAV